MKLSDYMRSKGLRDDDFAMLIGGKTTARAVKKWKYGETRPRLEEIARIDEVTDGEVRLADFLKNKMSDGAAA